ncbi:MAG: threonine synthase [Deferribacteres bacterium]|nr:threonine synthase [candidate division KSB1 bacterium]MCB9503865.1 threonine synthase [Deferribacteres bacterium]
MPNITSLKCTTCNKEYQPRDIDYTCPICGPMRGTLEVLYDYDRIAKELTRSSLQKNQNFTHWRYLPLLPIVEEKYIQPLSLGWTPIYNNQALADRLGIQNLWIKDDGRNPSASYKDRASSVAVVKALEKQVPTITAASTGNAASSLAAFTAVAGLPTVIFVPHNAPKAKITQLLLFGAKVLRVQGSYDDAFDLCCTAAEKWGWYNRSTAINPYLGEGKKTGAFEICEQLNWQVPDYVFVAVGDGCIYQSLWKGFKEFHRIGLIERLPKLIGVQAEGASPLVQAFAAGTDTAEPIQTKTFADSISVGVPRDQVKALKAVRESKGQFIAVSDDEIKKAIALLAGKAGVLAEPAGATGMAGLMKMAQNSEIKPDENAVVFVTGNGLKDIDGVMQASEQQSVLVDNDIADVAVKLKLV